MSGVAVNSCQTWHYYQQDAEKAAAEMTHQDGRARRVWKYVNGHREWWRISEPPTTRQET